MPCPSLAQIASLPYKRMGPVLSSSCRRSPACHSHACLTITPLIGSDDRHPSLVTNHLESRVRQRDSSRVTFTVATVTVTVPWLGLAST